MPINYKQYPANWKEIRQRILEREKHCCKECGIPNYEIGFRDNLDVWHKVDHSHQGDADAIDAYCAGYKVIKIVLTVAHLNHDITDNRDENLAALCQLHHLRHDLEHHKKNARGTLEKKKRLQRLFK